MRYIWYEKVQSFNNLNDRTDGKKKKIIDFICRHRGNWMTAKNKVIRYVGNFFSKRPQQEFILDKFIWEMERVPPPELENVYIYRMHLRNFTQNIEFAN